MKTLLALLAGLAIGYAVTRLAFDSKPQRPVVSVWVATDGNYKAIAVFPTFKECTEYTHQFDWTYWSCDPK